MNKKQIINSIYYLAIAVVAVYFAYFKGWIFTDFESISPKQAYELLENDKNIALLDVRTPKEFSQEHIQGATLIPVQELSQNLAKLSDVKDKKIIVYCHSGARSVAASRILVDNGFTPINVKGGITAWKSEGLSVTAF
ncbi:MAG: rhodanese-like domain-containing protein [Sulfuricurvum sp.]|jgi:rhodanese-related sulfurtransferase